MLNDEQWRRAADEKIGSLEDEVARLKRRLRMYRDEAVVLTREQFDALGEYSCSLPTGVTVGKRWKRNDHAFSPIVQLPTHWPSLMGYIFGFQRRAPHEPKWWLGEYVEHEDPEQVGIRWVRIAVRD